MFKRKAHQDKAASTITPLPPPSGRTSVSSMASTAMMHTAPPERVMSNSSVGTNGTVKENRRRSGFGSLFGRKKSQDQDKDQHPAEPRRSSTFTVNGRLSTSIPEEDQEARWRREQQAAPPQLQQQQQQQQQPLQQQRQSQQPQYQQQYAQPNRSVQPNGRVVATRPGSMQEFGSSGSLPEQQRRMSLRSQTGVATPPQTGVAVTPVPGTGKDWRQEFEAIVELIGYQPLKTYLASPPELEMIFARTSAGGTPKLGPPGSLNNDWDACWLQLSGTSLSMWSMKETRAAAARQEKVPPTYYNITDSSLELLSPLPPPPHRPESKPYMHIFSLNTAGSNRLLFSCPTDIDLSRWSTAMRLAAWERSRLEEIYTGHLIRFGRQEPRSPLVRGRLEGWVRLRVMGGIDWHRLWMVVSDPAEADKEATTGTAKRRTFFGMGDKNEPVQELNTGVPMVSFYTEPRTSKNKTTSLPVLTMTGVTQTYAVYPERLEVMMQSNLFKVVGRISGKIVTIEGGLRDSGWALIMPEAAAEDPFPPNPSTPLAIMMRWIVGFHDVFKLYGRPGRYSWNQMDPYSLFFGYPSGENSSGLFLNVDEAVQANYRLNTPGIREQFRALLQNRLHAQRLAASMGGGSSSNIQGIKEEDEEDDNGESGAAPVPVPEKDFTLPPLSFNSPGLGAAPSSAEGRNLGTGTSTESEASRITATQGPVHPPQSIPQLAQQQGGHVQPPRQAPAQLVQPSPIEQMAQPPTNRATPSVSVNTTANSSGSSIAAYPSQSEAHEQQKMQQLMTPASSSHMSAPTVWSQESGRTPTQGAHEQSVNHAQSSRATPTEPIMNGSGVTSTRSGASTPHSGQIDFSRPSVTTGMTQPVAPPQSETHRISQSQTSGPSSPPPHKPASPPAQPRSPLRPPPSAFNSNAAGLAAIGAGVVTAGATAAAVAHQSKHQQSPSPASQRQAHSPQQASQTSPESMSKSLSPVPQNTDIVHAPTPKRMSQSEPLQAGLRDEPAALYLMNMVEEPAPQITQPLHVKRGSIDKPNLPNVPQFDQQKQQQQYDQQPSQQRQQSYSQQQQQYAQPSSPQQQQQPGSQQFQQQQRQYQSPPQRPEVQRRPSGARAQQQSRRPSAGGAPKLDSVDDDIQPIAFATESRQIKSTSPERVAEPTAEQVPRSNTARDLSDAAAYMAYAEAPTSPTNKVQSPAAAPAQPASPVSQQPQTRSSFAPSKAAAERRAKVEAQAAEQQRAMQVPGGGRRAGGGFKPQRPDVWSGSDEDEDEDEIDDDQEPRQSQGPQITYDNMGRGGGAPRALPPVPGSSNSHNYPQQYQRYNPSQDGHANGDSYDPPNLAYLSVHDRPRSRGPSPPAPHRQLPQQPQAQGPQGQPLPQPPALKQNVWNANFAVDHGMNETRGGKFIELEEPSITLTKAFNPGGLLQAGMQDKADRSARRQEEVARETGSALINVPGPPPPPSTGLLGAVAAHERDRKNAGGIGATLTERDRERRLAEDRQRKIEELQRQQADSMSQYGGGGGMPYGTPYPQFSPYGMPSMGFNPYQGYQGMMNPAAQQQAWMAAQMAYQQTMMAMSTAGSQMGDDPNRDDRASPARAGSPPFPGHQSMYGGFGGFPSMPSMPSMGPQSMYGGFPGYGMPPGPGSMQGGWSNPNAGFRHGGFDGSPGGGSAGGAQGSPAGGSAYAGSERGGDPEHAGPGRQAS